ncbi:chemotaxis-specific protein-glutamate methyltransferase CheB [Pendulispora albinea]|uniref:Protein-glutamate methylesterase/protein-glutamine glutaminase n=1 Tax=Pendulispora albinea TaxID=2741071 RepID=A0ABZ2M7H5_9BACT
MSTAISVLIVEDSAFARKVLRDVLSAAEGIRVVGVAHDGLDALEKISELQPDVVTLDLLMPGLDGVGVLLALAERNDAPRVVVVTTLDEHSELGVAALQAGAVDVVQKPTAIATNRLYGLADELVEKVRVAAAAKGTRCPVATSPLDAAPAITAAATDVLVIGASTGGPRAVGLLLSALPKRFPVPIAIALHMPQGYTEAMAARFDADSAIEVREAHNGVEVRPGQAVIAPGGIHLRLRRVGQSCVTELSPEPVVSLHHPSVDVLFESASAGWGARALGVVLTGMGDDGLAGSRAIHGAGGRILTEAESSCVVYGMPRAVFEANLALVSAPIERMVSTILARL